MPLRQIDSFKVKPSGFLQPWRGRVVYFNEETYEITSVCPSKGQCMNLGNINDYKHKVRDYNEGQTISEFCSTFEPTRVKIIAQNAAPFAAVQLTPNSTDCGYVEPPAPSTPFGDPAPYGLYKYFNAFDTAGRSVRVDILKKNWLGAATEVQGGGEGAIMIRYENGGSIETQSSNKLTAAEVMDYKFYPITSTHVDLEIIALDDFSLQDLYTDDEREYQVTIKRRGEAPVSNTATVYWSLNNITGGQFIEAELKITVFSPASSATGQILVNTSVDGATGDFNVNIGDRVVFEAIVPNTTPWPNDKSGVNLEVTGEPTKRAYDQTAGLLTDYIVTTDQDILSSVFVNYSADKYTAIRSQVFTKNNCPGTTGTSVVFTKEYESSARFPTLPEVKQSALDDFSFLPEGQELANTSGSCTNTWNILWRGYILPDSCREPFQSKPYAVTIGCSDILGTLKALPYPMPKAISKSPRQTLLQVLSYCLYSTNLDLPLYTTDNLYELKMPKGIDKDPLAMTSINPFRLTTEDGNIMSCYDVLTAIATLRGARIYQANGAFHFERVIEKSNQVTTRRKYTPKGQFVLGEQISHDKTVGLRKEVELINYNANIQIDAPYKRVAVNWKYGYSPAMILNGNFELFTGVDEGGVESEVTGVFDYWTAFGGLDFSRTQKEVKNNVGLSTKLDDYMLTFNQAYNLNKWIQPVPVRVVKGDSISLFLNVGYPGTGYNIMYFRIRLGSQYIGNVDGALGDELGWAGDATTARRVMYGVKDINTYQLGLDLPAAPLTGDLYIEIIGFDQYKRESRTNTGGARPRDANNGSIPLAWIPAEYRKVDIDNISIAVNKANRENQPPGVTYLSQQEKYFTTTPEPIEILFADADKKTLSRGGSGFEFIGGTRPTRGEDITNGQIGILYRTFDADNATVTWSDGKFAQMPIGNVLAKTILTCYQKPGRVFEADFLSNDLYFYNTLEIDLMPNQVYMFLTAEFDLLNLHINRAIVAEVFGRPPKTIDSNFPTLSGGLPPVVQNPNSPSNTTPVGTKIFTPVFNDVFA